MAFLSHCCDPLICEAMERHLQMSFLEIWVDFRCSDFLSKHLYIWTFHGVPRCAAFRRIPFGALAPTAVLVLPDLTLR